MHNNKSSPCLASATPRRRQRGHALADRIVRIKAVHARTGPSRSTIYREIMIFPSTR
ncbi:AlpA family transcriptional regulator [Mesorhizobium sp. J428]|nr:AlpA family transcriptional regulator [Mesorhizobium sp. J428]MCR5858592.1 AlpA family transcriptional regulator [Mesorhizobium sp. J428]